jgi:hypothetical protein
MANLTATDLLDPRGKVLPSMFPTDSEPELEVRIEGWLADAYAKTEVAALPDPDDQNSAAESWVYFRTYDAVTTRLMNTPIRVDLRDQGAREYHSSQLSYFSKLRDEAFANFGRITSTDDSTPIDQRQTGFLQTGISW